MVLSKKLKLAMLDNSGKKMACKNACYSMRGKGVPMILRRLRKILGPLARKVGPVVLREWVKPYIQSKIGKGLRLAGTGKCGKRMRLAGGRHKKGKTVYY